MNIPAMGLITLAIFAERTLPWVRPVTCTTAAVLVAYGAIVLATPQVLPTFMVGGDAGMTAPAAPLGTFRLCFLMKAMATPVSSRGDCRSAVCGLEIDQ
jgi:hypothetical protein